MYGVFGDPVRHSKSPLMLNRAFREAKINATYAAFHVHPSRLADAVAGIRALGFGGVNVTIPHKLAVMESLDEVDEGARVIGAVNTIVHRDGKLIGYNTDGIGYTRSLIEETGIDLKGRTIVIIGARGAARSIAYSLALKGPERIVIANRTEAVAVELAGQLQRFGNFEGRSLASLAPIVERADLLVNTTSVGMHPNVEETPVPANMLHPGLTVSDIVYNPLTTRLLREAAERGCRVHGGLGMFIYQGAYAFEYWTGQPAPVHVMREAVEKSLGGIDECE